MASTIKVDNVQNQPGTNIVSKCGTDVTLGASGDTVALASGATQTGFGRTGTVDWITTPKVTGDSPVTGVTGKGYFLNTTAGEITINLPAGAAGSIVSLADYANTWQTNAVIVNPNGSEIIGGGAAGVGTRLEIDGQSVTLVYVDATEGWKTVQDSTSSLVGDNYVEATVSGSCNTLTSAPDCGNYKVALFKNPGTFCVSAIGSFNAKVDYMVIGGGGGAGYHYGGGGGGGGFRESKCATVSGCWTASPLATPTSITVTASPYPIVVGAGGASKRCYAAGPGVIGNASSALGIPSAGGGYGGGANPPSADGGAGGSGGGAGGTASGGTGGAGNTPPVSPPQGNVGGGSSGTNEGTGGGGAGTGVVCGKLGGDGVTNSITGALVARAGGGTAGPSPGSEPTPPGGTAYGLGGAANTGAGAGGDSTLYNGGSGVVIIRYRFQ